MILILGGTGRARRLAEACAEAGIDAVTSMAGRTGRPLAVAGPSRTGGFGGVAGMVAWLREHRPRAVVDATHPFADQISRHAVEACAETGVRLCRYEPPSWGALPEARQWEWVADHEQAAERARATEGAVLLTVGRQPLQHYLGLGQRAVLARMVDPPDLALPSRWSLILQRGPFALDDERALLAGPPRVGCLVSKDSGGERLDPKLLAAAELGAQVVMIARPQLPGAGAVLTRHDDVLSWLG